jgi:hypothetical protein
VRWDWKKNIGASWKLLLRDLWWHLKNPRDDGICPWIQSVSYSHLVLPKSQSLSRLEPVVVDRPVVGFRVFRLFDGGRKWDVMGRLAPAGPLRLAPLNEGFGDWQPGVNVAQHAGHVHLEDDPATDHVCPDPRYQCGFWILFDLNAAGVKDSWSPESPWVPVIGAVQGWGRVQEHGDGWRVQYASVLALSLKPPTGVVVPVALVPYAENVLKRLCREWDIVYVEDFAQLSQEVKSGKAF